ncbi:hypothetical protein CHR53_08960 [Neobacillus mesonae]|uniref:Uncharacterized protein n=1 Tax=Neobacillus mesonae TaxID=1193713 RepID=A0A3Q9QSW0_9BACI|nr:hypothetical protein CHR53_08960 [Neobacillus mesonae]
MEIGKKEAFSASEAVEKLSMALDSCGIVRSLETPQPQSDEEAPEPSPRKASARSGNQQAPLAGSILL